ncbi:copper resistance CopC family protein [Nostocoides sp. HKS02]|uniref:copper resistance CopC family protein n=1 Tax=Nostocoides sp. HKS02 TaxID=1813880 RepID=UPI0018A7F29E|nr:copper resistance CopC family protein [Tetrasphaera sp. HKS02]
MFTQQRTTRRSVAISTSATLLGLALGVLGSVALASAAQAHAALVAASPASGSVLYAPPSRVVLRFSDPVSTSFATVSVTDGAGRSVDAGPATVDGAVVTQPLAPGLASGRYAVSYRIVSDDGHPVSDTYSFSVALPGDGSASADATAAPTKAPTQPAGGGSADPHAAGHGATGTASNPELRVGLAVAVGTLALAAGTALVAASRRRQRS